MIAPETTIPQLVLGAAERHASRTAIEDGGTVIGYPELASRSLDAARAFIAAGLEPGDRVAVWAPNIWEWIVATVGAQMAGGVLVPVNTRMKGAEAGYVLRRSRARLLFTVGDFLDTRYVELLADEELPDLERIVTLRGTDPQATPFDDFLSSGASVDVADARARAESVKPDDLADIMFTSGTTGNPKGVMSEHGQNLRVFNAWSDTVGLRADDRYLIVNPFFHAFGYKAGWMSSFICGATVLPHLVFDAPEVLKRISEDRISMFPGPPALYQSILSLPDLEEYDVSTLRLAVTGAAAIPVELVQRMKSDLGFETVVTGYGLTECTGTVTMCRHDDDIETIATTSGRAIPDIEVRCVDGDDKEVPPGEPGEVVVRGYNLMRGYYDDPEETAKTIDAEGWLHTGDIGVMDERGNLRITDRKKDMYIMGGFNCYPAEIENLMFSHPGIAQAAVIGIPDERMGEVGMAFVVPAPGAQLDEAEVIAWCREKMANYKVPRRVEVLDELPMNATGKVMKFVLRERAESRPR